MGTGALGVMDGSMRTHCDARSRDAGGQSHRGAQFPSVRAICKAALLTTLVMGTAWAMSAVCVATPTGVSRANRPNAASPECSARYAALLDLAELARRDGQSSALVVRALSDRHGAMSGCLPAHALSGSGTVMP